MPLLILDVLLEAPRLLTMNMVDIEADLTINKVTLAGVLGYARSAKAYKMGMRTFAMVAFGLILSSKDKHITYIICVTALVVLPQMSAVSQQLQRLAEGKLRKQDKPDIWVSILEIELLIIFIGMLWFGGQRNRA